MTIDYKRLREDAETGSFFQIYFETDLHEYAKHSRLLTKEEKKIIKQEHTNEIAHTYNKNSRVTPESWEQHKETFFTQRMETYKDSYTLVEKIKLELIGLEKLTINKADYQILKFRYKAYLEQKQALPAQPIDKEQNRTKQVIAETFENMDKKGWQYAFVYEQDYNLFTDLLTNFFESKTYTLPETIIQLKRACKTKVGKVLGEIHKELSYENKLSTDTKYFQLIRVLSHFEKETEGDLYKALTR